MGRASARSELVSLLDGIDVEVDGSRPWDPRVHDARFFQRVLSQGSLGLGESYMDGWWDCDDLDELFFRVLSSRLPDRTRPPARLLFEVARARLLNMQTRRRSRRVADFHYDLRTDLWQAVLGRSMAYTCAYWRDATSLDEAQEHKLDLVCRKLQLRPSDRVLDLGSGWGAFARFAGERVGCHIDSVNIAGNQVRFSRDFCKGLPVRVHHCDYREVEVYNPEGRPYDAVLALGLGEHIGPRNYASFLRLAEGQLVDRGLLMMHHVASITSRTTADPWLERYIFPGAVPPSVAQLSQAMEPTFVMEDWHNFGADYHPTLRAWSRNFEDWAQTEPAGVERRFRRMWRYYLLSLAGAFRSRRALQLHQIVVSKGGSLGYRSLR